MISFQKRKEEMKMEERKVNSKRKSLDALLSITKQLDDKEVRRVADICQGMVLAKAALSSNEKLKRKEHFLSHCI